MKSSNLLALVLATALPFLALASSAQTQPKTPPPSGPTPVQTEERIKQLESRADAAEKAAASAALEKDYITRIQKQYESYYEKAFNTMLGIVGIIGMIIAVISLVAGKFGLDFFDRRVQAAVTKAQDDVTATMKTELDNLRKENAAQSQQLKTTLTAQIDQLGDDLKHRSNYQFQFTQGLVFGTNQQFERSIGSYRRAVKNYKVCKPRELVSMGNGTVAMQNLFIVLKKAHPDTFKQKAKEELADPLYDDLDDELATVALELSWLVPLIKERKQEPPTPREAPPEPAAPTPQQP